MSFESIPDTLDHLRQEWAVAKRVGEDPNDQYAHLLACSIRPRLRTGRKVDLPAGVTVPAEVLEFWRTCDSAELFKDVVHGQWGLRLLSDQDAVDATRKYSAEDFRSAFGDFVVGSFIGDGELLIVRADARATDFGKIIVVDEIHKRVNWLIAAENFRNFLTQYARRMGRKYWVDEPVYVGGKFS